MGWRKPVGKARAQRVQLFPRRSFSFAPARGPCEARDSATLLNYESVGVSPTILNFVSVSPFFLINWICISRLWKKEDRERKGKKGDKRQLERAARELKKNRELGMIAKRYNFPGWKEEAKRFASIFLSCPSPIVSVQTRLRGFALFSKIKFGSPSSPVWTNEVGKTHPHTQTKK